MIRLTPFQATPATQPWSLTVIPTRKKAELSLAYCLEGPMDTLEIPIASSPARAHDLWTTTCFEFFVGQPYQPEYWEFNLSPSGCWNLYHFDHYRHSMREEQAVTALPFAMDQQNERLQLTVTFDLAQLGRHFEQPTTKLELGITTVLKTKAGDLSYWAIAHTGPEADFHRRDSFICRL